jgi:hypothetical protein
MVEISACHICGDWVINKGTVQVFVSDKGRVSTIELEPSPPSLLRRQGREVQLRRLSPKVNFGIVRIISLANLDRLQSAGSSSQL